jgi:predicted DNA-binding protein (UPF0278 family)
VLIVIDAANVVGSVPDGWWRDRAGATERLRDALATAGPGALEGAADDDELVLVVEGAARRVSAAPGVRVVSADGSGDDAIVDLLRSEGEGDTVVVTADRGLRDRVAELGARVVGPSALRIPGRSLHPR